jgi:hypothetical protein
MAGIHFSLRGCASYQQAKRLGRRGFLRAGALGALGLTLPHYLGLQAAQQGKSARAKSVLLIYAMGGISHHDTFDPKPDAPREVRGEFGTIATRVPGVRFSDQVPLLARDLDRYALVRSVYHRETDHGVGAYLMLRGYSQPDPSLDRPENQLRANPTMGAHVARLLGPRNGMPPYMVVPGLSYLAQINYYTAGWMGRNYDPFVLKADCNQSTSGALDLVPLFGIAPERLRARASLATALDARSHRFEASRPAKSMTSQYEKAYRMLTSGAAQRAFDLRREPDKIRRAYGQTRLGQGCLLGRRLVEAGVPFVTVDDDGWDHHSKVFPGLRERLPDLDRSLTTLLRDLEDRGLLSSTLVLLLTDFGRTPVVNASAGRDHWPGVFSVILAGAGIRGGQVIGASDKIGAHPAKRPISPKDIVATIYRFLDIDPFQDYLSTENRLLKVLDEGEVIAEL